MLSKDFLEYETHQRILYEAALARHFPSKHYEFAPLINGDKWLCYFPVVQWVGFRFQPLLFKS